MFRVLAFVTAVSAILVAVGSELEPPMNVQAGGKPIDVEGVGYAAPFYSDFDGDGIHDLLVGEFFQGRMRIYPNKGTNAEPKFDEYVFFQTSAGAGRVPTG